MAKAGEKAKRENYSFCYKNLNFVNLLLSFFSCGCTADRDEEQVLKHEEGGFTGINIQKMHSFPS
jgi:hypothetical protein